MMYLSRVAVRHAARGFSRRHAPFWACRKGVVRGRSVFASPSCDGDRGPHFEPTSKMSTSSLADVYQADDKALQVTILGLFFSTVKCMYVPISFDK
jgi:hypothetical protein